MRALARLNNLAALLGLWRKKVVTGVAVAAISVTMGSYFVAQAIRLTSFRQVQVAHFGTEAVRPGHFAVRAAIPDVQVDYLEHDWLLQEDFRRHGFPLVTAGHSPGSPVGLYVEVNPSSLVAFRAKGLCSPATGPCRSVLVEGLADLKPSAELGQAMAARGFPPAPHARVLRWEMTPVDEARFGLAMIALAATLSLLLALIRPLARWDSRRKLAQIVAELTKEGFPL
ncbi:MAG: hypothetical protein IPG96_17690 [Proteobacteria bacterium]|nr:hypothetical protein [Pseudomonadota bacterium]